MNKLILIFVLIIISFKSYSQAVVFDKGGTPCYEFITEYEQIGSQYLKSQKDGQITTTNEEYIDIVEFSKWITFYFGYVSRMNIEVNESLFEKMSSQAITIELKNFCEKNPSDPFIFAIMRVSEKYQKDN